MTDNTAPRLLIEDWLPVTELGIESRRERAFVAAIPDLFSLHVWWARRPLVASAGVILASLLPPWSEQLAAAFPGEVRVDTEAHYKRWFLHLCGIWGDPVAGRAMLDRANAEGRKIQGNGYGYKQAYKNSPNPADLDLLHRVLERSWGELPNVIDPTAGGHGSGRHDRLVDRTVTPLPHHTTTERDTMTTPTMHYFTDRATAPTVWTAPRPLPGHKIGYANGFGLYLITDDNLPDAKRLDAQPIYPITRAGFIEAVEALGDYTLADYERVFPDPVEAFKEFVLSASDSMVVVESVPGALNDPLEAKEEQQ